MFCYMYVIMYVHIYREDFNELDAFTARQRTMVYENSPIKIPDHSHKPLQQHIPVQYTVSILPDMMQFVTHFELL
jgi:hypothetical protein